jgi:hypothetical protein
MQAFFFASYIIPVRSIRPLKGQTPAIAAGITGKIWTVRDLLEGAAEV